ncbi:MAG: hypothetical protein H6822_35840 [Planctomycetaceae bacterium]|nr:hypothetical protein [Planctomycetales bacterium]MCB9927562.1 hypothetical protein [Planctomycetaceae bacterium]
MSPFQRLRQRSLKRLSRGPRQRKLHVEQLEDRRLLAASPFEASFDFGTTSSPVAGGFTRISESTRYTGDKGYGWTNGTISSRDRNVGNAAEQDFNFTTDGTFAVDVPNGEYEVTVVVGDLGRYAHDDVGVFLESVQRDRVTTNAGSLSRATHTVEVTDGQLTLRIADLGGRDANGCIESLVIKASGPVVPVLSVDRVREYEGNSGTRDFVFMATLSSSTTEAVSVQYSTSDGSAVAGSDYTASTGTLDITPGQTSGEIRISVSGDLVIEPDETFHVNLSNVVGATLEVAQVTGTIVTDDIPPTLSILVSPTSVSEGAGAGAAVGTVTRSGATDASLRVSLTSNDTGEASVPPYVDIEAGRSTAQFAITAHDDTEIDGPQNVTITASASGLAPGSALLQVTDDDRPPFEAQFDFGTSSSPVASNSTRIHNGSRYSSVIGYGWVSGAIYAADRGTTSPLTRDFNYTQSGVFAVDVPDGLYQVDVILGDLGRYAHDYVGVYVENALVETVSTSAYQIKHLTHEVEVTDGQLTLRLQDLGGRDANCVIESLTILSTGPIVPPAPVVPTLSIGDAQINEGNSGTRQISFPVTLSSTADVDVMVDFETSDVTANAGEDYTATSGTVRIPSGTTHGSIQVIVMGDEKLEPDESFLVTLKHSVGATLSDHQATGTIRTDDLPPKLSLSISPTSIVESSGPNAVTGTVNRTGSTASSVVVNLATSDASEAKTPQSVTIEAGKSAASFVIDVVDDPDVDGTQNVTVTASAANYDSGNAVLEVTDDDRPPFEGHYDFGTTSSPLNPGFVRVSQSTGYSKDRGYGWSAGAIYAADRGVGSALARDFNFTQSGTFSVDVPNGRYEVKVILGDLGRYAHDNVGVYLEGTKVDSVSTAAGQVVTRSYETDVSDSQMTFRITDLGGRDANGVIESLEIVNSGPIVPQISINDVSMSEGDSGTKDFVFDVTLSDKTTVDVTVDYATRDGQAKASSDYASVSGSLRFTAGQTTQSIRVPVTGDGVIESDENFFVVLSNAVAGVVSDDQGLGTILNDDFPPTLTVTIAPTKFSESAGSHAATGTVTRTGPTTTLLAVGLTNSDTSEADFPASVDIPAGETFASFQVMAKDDPESDGTQVVTITAAAVGYVTGQTQFQVTDDDIPPFEGFFDFGTASSPLSPGHHRVAHTTTYSAGLGYGWVAGAIDSRDRGSGGPVERDMNYTADGTFVVDVPNGSYWVDLLLGDKASYAHDAMGVFLEGVQLASVSTAAGRVVNRSLNVEVVDGQLTLRLRDLGGGDQYVVIEGLRILPQGTDEPRSNAWWPAYRDIPNALFTAPTQSGVYEYYTVDSTYEYSATNIRVLLPEGYDPTVEYPVIYVLPVEKNNGRQFGDGMTSIYNHGLHRQYDAIFVSPTFSETPWYADNASNVALWQETYFRSVIVPFIEKQYPVIDGPDGRLLLGYSKSGYGAVSMLLRHPDYFGRAVAWDAPLAMSNPADGWDFLKVVGTRQNFQNNYQITNLIRSEGYKLKDQPPRIILQGYSYSFTRADHATVDALMTSLDIPHIYEPGTYRSHLWASGWLPDAVDALLVET